MPKEPPAVTRGIDLNLAPDTPEARSVLDAVQGLSFGLDGYDALDGGEELVSIERDFTDDTIDRARRRSQRPTMDERQRRDAIRRKFRHLGDIAGFSNKDLKKLRLR